jgi:hypothetical protein
MPNPWVSLRRDQLIPLNKALNKKEQLEKGAGGGGGKKYMMVAILLMCLKHIYYRYISRCAQRYHGAGASGVRKFPQ